MNENVESNTPVTETEVANDDFFGEIDDEVIKENQASEENEESEESSEPSETDEESKETDDKEIDFAPFLDYLSKNAKYNKESVTVDNMEDVINNFQKGLNYDKLQEKLTAIQNSKAETYISRKAKELGMTVDEYMDQVEAYEKQQEKEKQEARFQEMIDNGVPEDIAKEVLATSELRKELEAMKAEQKAKEAAAQEKANKDKEYEDFLNAYPDVKADDIPAEVFEKAKNMSLKEAYTEWKLADLERQLSIKKTNEKNAESSIGSVTDTGTTNESEKGKDLFLEGFES